MTSLSEGANGLIVTIGTPAQPLSLQIDTGSSDIWTEIASSQLCKSSGSPCADTGTYDNTTSSTYKFVNSDFDIQYQDGTEAVGDYATETFGIGNAIVTDLEFGVGTESTSTEGVMGIGFDTNEAIVQFGIKPYPNLPDQLVSQNFIQSRAFSLYLNDLDAQTGVVLFGGVDTARYNGQLATFPINTISGGVATAFSITLTGMSVTPPSGAADINVANNSGFPVPIVLDSGSSYLSLPSGMLQSLAQILGATYSNQVGGYIFQSCLLQYRNASVNFFFSGLEIKVPFDEIIVQPTDTNGETITLSNGQPLCMIGAVPNPSGQIGVLGDTFLRSAYVVYDLDNSEISLAQTRFNSTDTNIVAIGKGSGAVPNASPIPNPTTIVLTNSGYKTPSSVPSGGTSVTETVSPGGGIFGSVTASSTSTSGSSSLAGHMASPFAWPVAGFIFCVFIGVASLFA